MLLHYENVGTRPLDERAVEVLYQCLQCSHCLTWCLPEIDIATIVEMARTKLVEESRYPSGLEKITRSILQNHNPFEENHKDRNSWFSRTPTKSKKIIYFSGCTSSYREMNIAKATSELLQSMEYEVLVSDEEWCCGSPLLRTGFVNEALEQAKHNVETLNAMDGELIVASCPGCFVALTQDYKKHGLELNKEVKHISQFLDETIVSSSEIRLDKRVTYHDPCHLGRHAGIYDPPRQVIFKASGIQVTEMERNRENATCCGNGAGLRVLFPEQAKMIGNFRTEDAKQVESELLVTSCPFCKNMLASQAEDSIEVLDLSEFVIRMNKGLYTKDD